MPRYMLLVYEEEARRAAMGREADAAFLRAYREFAVEASRARALVGGDRLMPASTATTVRVRDGEVLVTDGPFAETRELGGYFLVECQSLDEALRWAGRVPSARIGSVEVRPVMEMPERGR